MTKKIAMFVVIILAAAAFWGMAVAQEGKDAKAAKPQFVGEAKCKMCHKQDGIHPSWTETKHAKAWALLNEEQKKDKECVRCHSTGVDAEGKILEGVQCEACHGAGSEYKKKTIMENREQAIAAGLVIPTEKVCKACHENVPEQFRSKEQFDFEKMKAKGVHAMPAKTGEKKS